MPALHDDDIDQFEDETCIDCGRRLDKCRCDEDASEDELCAYCYDRPASEDDYPFCGSECSYRAEMEGE